MPTKAGNRGPSGKFKPSQSQKNPVRSMVTAKSPSTAPDGCRDGISVTSTSRRSPSAWRTRPVNVPGVPRSAARRAGSAASREASVSIRRTASRRDNPHSSSGARPIHSAAAALPNTYRSSWSMRVTGMGSASAMLCTAVRLSLRFRSTSKTLRWNVAV